MCCGLRRSQLKAGGCTEAATLAYFIAGSLPANMAAVYTVRTARERRSGAVRDGHLFEQVGHYDEKCDEGHSSASPPWPRAAWGAGAGCRSGCWAMWLVAVRRRVMSMLYASVAYCIYGRRRRKIP